MKTLPAEQLYYYHNLLSIIMLFICILFCYLGCRLKSYRSKKKLSLFLIYFCLLQEFIDYVNRIYWDDLYHFSWATDLPLQFCVIGFYFSIIGVYLGMSYKKINHKTEQFFFDVAYVLGFGGALQALINVDLTGVNNMIGAFALNWTHSLIILNVLWLIFAYNKRFNVKGIINAFLFINFIIIPVGAINYFLDSNYMFICYPPSIESSFFIGGWPYYLLYLEIIYFIYICILYLPFQIFEKHSKKPI